eukprot:Selendium_serpulae@DN6413_c4_g1_i4.p1
MMLMGTNSKKATKIKIASLISTHQMATTMTTDEKRRSVGEKHYVLVNGFLGLNDLRSTCKREIHVRSKYSTVGRRYHKPSAPSKRPAGFMWSREPELPSIGGSLRILHSRTGNHFSALPPASAWLSVVGRCDEEDCLRCPFSDH